MTSLASADHDLLFRNARTHRTWKPEPVADDLLRELYELVKFGPTSANCCPLRITFVRTPEGKAKLLPTLDKGNVEKSRTAPVVAILAYDVEFYKNWGALSPRIDVAKWLVDNAGKAEALARDNAWLQAGYFILAARSLGLDCGPMGGFDQAAINAAFFAGTTFRAHVVINLGHGDASGLFPRNARLSFDEACTWA